MKLSEKWLREWVNPPIDTTALSHQLTMAGLEIDGIHPVAEALTGVIVAEVLAVAQHPNADRLRVCQVSTGAGEPLEIVCGAANVRPGLKVALATLGATLGNITIKKSKLRGVESSGMLCSAVELGIAEQSEGLIELPLDAPLGKDICDYLQLNDHVLDISLTPNRADCLSVQGIAREMAALNALSLNEPKIAAQPIKINDSLPVQITAVQDCPHYAGRIIRGINAKAQTPLWMQERLRRGGIRSISAIVDITNYVLLELGQPLHAFDLAKIDQRIVVRHANPNEKLTLLDGQTLTLSESCLVIADKIKALALAGIMGGNDSAVTLETTDIFLESAFFAPELIMGRARQFGLHTDSSHRFERGVSPALQNSALERATQFILEIAGGQCGPVSETIFADYLPVQKSILLRRARLTKLIGIEIADATVVDSLQRLNMNVSPAAEGWQVIPPAYRFDMAIEADLIEEVARLVGYDQLPAIKPIMTATFNTESEVVTDLIRQKQCLVSRGYHEVISYSFVDEKIQQLLEPGMELLRLKNPINPDMAVMRTTLWTGLLQTLLYNRNRQQPNAKLFEVGLRYRQVATEIVQEKMLAGLVAGTRYPLQWGIATSPIDFYDVKNDVLALLGLPSYTVRFERVEHSALHPGRSAKVILANECIGILGELHPAIAQQCDIDNAVYLFELDLGKYNQGVPAYCKFAKVPMIMRDLALVVDEQLTAESLEAVIRKQGEWIKEVTLFDVYRGKSIEAGKKSIAIRLLLQHSEQTLSDDEISQIMNKIVNALSIELHAELRV